MAGSWGGTIAQQATGSKASRMGSILMPKSSLISPPMAWQRQMDAGVPRSALRGAQQLAGGPEITVPIVRNGAQLLSSINVAAQFVGLPYGVGGGGGGLAAVAWSTAIATTTMARKETVDVAIAAASDWCRWWWSMDRLVYNWRCCYIWWNSDIVYIVITPAQSVCMLSHSFSCKISEPLTFSYHRSVGRRLLSLNDEWYACAEGLVHPIPTDG